MSLSLVGNVLGFVGHGSLTVIKSSTTLLGLELVSRAVESIYHNFTEAMPRPNRDGVARVIFKIIRPFSGEEGIGKHYKTPTNLLVVSTIGFGALTFLGSQFATSYQIPSPAPIVFHILDGFKT